MGEEVRPASFMEDMVAFDTGTPFSSLDGMCAYRASVVCPFESWDVSNGSWSCCCCFSFAFAFAFGDSFAFASGRVSGYVSLLRLVYAIERTHHERAHLADSCSGIYVIDGHTNRDFGNLSGGICSNWWIVMWPRPYMCLSMYSVSKFSNISICGGS
jgi:hypothetical protein